MPGHCLGQAIVWLNPGPSRGFVNPPGAMQVGNTGWIAALGKLVVKNYAGFPTSKALNTFVEQNHLSEIHLSKSLFYYEAVLQKNSIS